MTESGWDARPWEGAKALVRTGRHPDKFRDVFGASRSRHRDLTAGDLRLTVPTTP